MKNVSIRGGVLGAVLLSLLTGGAIAAPVQPVVHYTFNNAANLYNDFSGSGLHATGVNAPPQSTTDPPFGAGALSLDGSTQYLDLPAGFNAGLFPGGAATLSMWIRLDNAGAQSGSLAAIGGSSNSHYPWTSGNAYFTEFRNPRVDNVPLTEVPPGSLDQWHHLAITTDPGDAWRLYQNGVEIHNATPGTFAIDSDPWIGRNNGGQFVDGLIDEVQLFDVALSPEEIQNLILFNSTEPPPEVPEPGTLLLGLVAVSLAAGHTVWRRRRAAHVG